MRETPGNLDRKCLGDGAEIGKGSLTLMDSSPNEEIIGQLVFLTPHKTQSQDRWQFEASGGFN